MVDFAPFKKAFSDKLSIKLKETGKVLPKDVISKMSDDFVNAIIDFKLKIAADETSMIIVKGEVAWSPSRDRLISVMSSKLDEIFKPIGGIHPGEQAAFWSQQGKVQAQLAGQNLESTIAGFLLEQIGNELNSTFTPNAYKTTTTKQENEFLDIKTIKDSVIESPLSTATNIGIWNAISKLYAQGTEGDTHVYLVDGSTSYQSVFWNTELQQLRLMQRSGEIKEIFLHTLKEDKLTEYNALIADKTTMVAAHKEQYVEQAQKLSLSGLKDTDKKAILAGTKALQEEQEQKIAKKAQGVLENANNWDMQPLADAKLKIKISGFTGDRAKLPDVKYSAVVNAADRLMGKQNPATRFRAVVQEARSKVHKEVTDELKEDIKPRGRAPQ